LVTVRVRVAVGRLAERPDVRLTEGVIRGRRPLCTRTGDDALFDEMVRGHGRAVRASTHSIASTSTIAEDATQQTSMRAWRHLDSFRGSGSRQGWLPLICEFRPSWQLAIVLEEP